MLQTITKLTRSECRQATSALSKAMSTQTSKPGYDQLWMPFTHQRSFKKNPKIFHRAEGMYYYLEDGTSLLDGAAGLWCVNAGHGHKKITEAIRAQAGKLDFASNFNVGHQLSFDFAQKVLELLPDRGFKQVFFTNCGSSAVDTALKIALAYHRAKGNAGKSMFIGREKGYHGVGFGGISVGGIATNRKTYNGNLLHNVDHICHTHSLPDMAYSKGLPSWGLHLAEDLERVIALHDASNIACLIIEPVIGSSGVIPPPQGYLERIREICTKHDILLIFDEVITGFGRVGTPFATTKFNVTPDIITAAKGLTNAAVPAGAVICQGKLYQALMDAADKDGGSAIEMFHGYTYSGHPLAMAAGLAALEVYQDHDMFNRSTAMAPFFEQAIHSLKGLPNVVDIRNCGMMGAVELSPVPGAPFKRAMDIFQRCYDNGVFVRGSGISIALSPPLIVNEQEIERIISTLSDAIVASAKEL
jgi:beta-alanine--pyruvate transaminase